VNDQPRNPSNHKIYLLGVLVFSSGELDVRKRLLQLEVTVEVVGVKYLFPPVNFDACLFASSDQVDSVWLSRSSVFASQLDVISRRAGEILTTFSDIQQST